LDSLDVNYLNVAHIILLILFKLVVLLLKCHFQYPSSVEEESHFTITH